MPPVTIEMFYPSGHRQLWRQVKIETPPIDLYECVTYGPDGCALEFRILSSGQLRRTLKRVRGLGGSVRVHQCPPPMLLTQRHPGDS